MARTKTDDLIVVALGQRRSAVAAKLAQLRASEIETLEAELAEIEAKLQTIDPEIKTLAEEALDAEVAAGEVELVEGDNPATPEVEQSWYQKVLSMVGLKS
jgi:hypothetical protein